MTENSNKNIKPVLIVLLGPTGVGKTQTSLSLASFLNCPIVSSDSRQIFKELSIGTAAPTQEELNQAKHYFIHTHSIFDSYSAGEYELDVLNLLNQLFQENPYALLVGGSMMYIDAVCDGMDDIPSVDEKTRLFWQNEFAENGLEYIQQKLKKMDPVHFLEVDLQNPKRILHALEVCTVAGVPFSTLRTGRKKQRPFQIIKIGLNRPRPELYEQINQRVDLMMTDGLLEEAKPFYEYRKINSLNTVGYKELFDYMAGKCSLDQAVELIKRDSRHYAKRQLTWFRRDETIRWFHPDQQSDILTYVKSQINEG